MNWNIKKIGKARYDTKTLIEEQVTKLWILVIQKSSLKKKQISLMMWNHSKYSKGLNEFAKLSSKAMKPTPSKSNEVINKQKKELLIVFFTYP